MTETIATSQTWAVRVARALASPKGVLVTLPALVIVVGVGIALFGRNATLSAAHDLARRQLAQQAVNVQEDFSFALDQADPLLARMRLLADEQRSIEDVLPRLYDLIVGRPGVAYLSLSFPDGTFRGAYLANDKQLQVQESRIGGEVRRFRVEGGALVLFEHEPNRYDPRERDFYKLATKTGARAWTEPYTFFMSHETGITCTEPLLDASHGLVAVLTVDFDVGAMSSYLAKPGFDQARSVAYTRGGTILAYPAADRLGLPTTDKLLNYQDLHDSALEALVSSTASNDAAFRFRELATKDGEFLASIAPIGGKRAGVAVPLDWYVATVVPSAIVLGPTHDLERSSLFASGGAVAIAVALALVLAWNLVRMRKQVAASRAEAKSAEARARELGSYRLVAKLGTGGMGEVWRAEHRLLARSAAIKLIRPEALDTPSAVAEIRERFRREAQTLASMKSRHTIAIYDYGVTAESTFYYVMELLDGLDLESIVVRYGHQPAARVIRMLIQACASLAEAHDAGLLHRDIKPPNLFLCRAADEVDILKLLDFGIVQTTQEPPRPRAASISESSPIETPRLTQLGALLGTPGFMAPEQILGMQLDGRADLYALGCCAWWLLTGGEVFSRDQGDAKLHHRHLAEKPPKLAAAAFGWIPDELERVIQSCLAKEPDDRPSDARALARQLRAIEIPAEHEWTAAKARAWWAEYKPPAPQPNVPSAEVQIVVPQRTDGKRESPTQVERSSAPTLIEGER